MQDLSHRKARCIVRISDKGGKPMANARFHLKQVRHEFLFGCGAFDVLSYVSPPKDMPKEMLEKMFCRLFPDDNFNAFSLDAAAQKLSDINKQRTEMWLDLYNYATLPFYWGQFERVEGKPETESHMNCARYLSDRGVKVKGHPLCWHTVCADWLLKYDNETILNKQLARIRREVTDFKGIIDKWDVINEVVIMPVFDRYDNAVTRICKQYGRIELVKRVFDEAYAANPCAELLINDFNTSSAYEDLIDECLNAGVKLTAIGIQSHQHQGFWGEDKLYDVLERYSKFGLPIHFTENTLTSGPLIPPEIEDLNDWEFKNDDSSPEGEARQADEMEKMYRILFGHPLVEAVTGWDFTDGGWLNAPSGIVRRDNTKKPAYEMLKNLIKHEWHTDCEFCTDDNGNAEIEGFLGDYEISYTGDAAAGSVACVDSESANNKITDVTIDRNTSEIRLCI